MSDRNGLGDFDFFVGSWNSIQRRLMKPLADSDDWEESSATTRCWQLFGGAANVDEVHFPDEGRDITVRYKWSDITATTARWEQAFSPDGGQSWETNWTADFTRTD